MANSNPKTQKNHLLIFREHFLKKKIQFSSWQYFRTLRELKKKIVNFSRRISTFHFKLTISCMKTVILPYVIKKGMLHNLI